MTEAEWLSGTDPDSMAEFLRRGGRRASNRQLWLFACACCRRLARLLASERGRAAVEAAERYADALITDQELAAAAAGDAAWVAFLFQMAPKKVPGLAMPRLAAMEASADPPASRQAAQAAVVAKQAALLRDIIGNPFRPVTIAPVWLAWNDGAVIKLAQAIYEERSLPSGHLDATRLAVLADMLEEAGCADAELLSHLRSPGPHVRGCWVVDLLLGRG